MNFKDPDAAEVAFKLYRDKIKFAKDVIRRIADEYENSSAQWEDKGCPDLAQYDQAQARAFRTCLKIIEDEETKS